jgi:hypothetical protein
VDTRIEKFDQLILRDQSPGLELFSGCEKRNRSSVYSTAIEY